MAAEPVALPAPSGRPGGADPAGIEFRRVRLDGAFAHDKELYLGARSLNGNAGYQIVTPFVLAGGGSGPGQSRLGPGRAQAAGPAAPRARWRASRSLDGIVRLPHGQAWLQPDNEPQHNMWFFVDLPAMAAAAGRRSAHRPLCRCRAGRESRRLPGRRPDPDRAAQRPPAIRHHLGFAGGRAGRDLCALSPEAGTRAPQP